MRRWIVSAIGMALLGTSALAQNQPSPEQLQTLYQDALNQLKAAQDRKNELATENQKLQKRQQELLQQLADKNAMAERASVQLQKAQDYNIAWHNFIALYQPLQSLFKRYVSVTNLHTPAIQILGDGSWPFTIEDD